MFILGGVGQDSKKESIQTQNTELIKVAEIAKSQERGMENNMVEVHSRDDGTFSGLNIVRKSFDHTMTTDFLPALSQN